MSPWPPLAGLVSDGTRTFLITKDTMPVISLKTPWLKPQITTAKLVTDGLGVTPLTLPRDMSTADFLISHAVSTAATIDTR